MNDPRLALLRSRPLPSQSGFIPIPPTPFIPIDALRQNIAFYQSQLAQLQAQERIYNLGALTQAVSGFRQRTLINPIIRKTTRYNGINHTIISYYYTLPKDDNWIPYTRNAIQQSSYIGNRDGVQTQLVLSQYPVEASADFHLGQETLKTTFRFGGANALTNLIQKKADKEELYDEEFILDTLVVMLFIPNNNLVIVQGTGRSEKSATDTWLIIDKKARTNCFYNCLAVLKFSLKKNNNETNEDYRLRLVKFVDDEVFRNEKISMSARDLKRYFKPPITSFTDLNIIKQYCDYTKNNNNQKTIGVKLYNNIFDNFENIYDTHTQNNIDDIIISDLDDDVKAQGIKNILKPITIYEIQYINNHFIPLVRWRNIPVSKPIETDGQQISLSEAGNTTTMIKKWSKLKPLDLKISSYDLEATANGVPYFTTYCASFCWYDPELEIINKKIFWGLDAVAQMINYIYEERELLDGYTIYAHNNGKFDMLLVFNDYVLTNPDCPWKIANDESRKTICLNGAYIGVCLYTDDGKEIFFKDSLKMMPMGLDALGKELKVAHQKLKSVMLPDGREVEIDFKDINIDNWDTYEVRESQKIYCLQDSMCLIEALLIFAKEVHNDTKINITDCFTGASLSKKHFFTSFYDHNKYPIYSLSRELDDFFRESYFGGRNEAFFLGEYNGRCWYVDFTSLYPDVGRKMLPYGIPKQMSDEKLKYVNDLLKKSDGLNSRNIPFGFYRCWVKTKKFTKTIPAHTPPLPEDGNVVNQLPLHAIKFNGKLTFPHFDGWTKITLFSEELKLGYQKGLYDYKVIDAFQFRKAPFMKDFFNSGFTKKAEAKANENPALAQTQKIIINSGYGFWGLNTLGKDKEGRDGVEIWKGESMSFWDAYNSEGIVNIGHQGDYTIMRCKKELAIADFNVAVASAITSWARIKIWSFMNDMTDKGAVVLYADTDSAILSKSMKEFPDIMEKYCWDGNGDALGSMKNEADDEVKGHYKDVITKEYASTPLGAEWVKTDLGIATIKQDTKDLFNIQYKYDNEDIFWDGMIGGGCKQYALKKELLDIKQIEIAKMKGYKSKGEGGKKLKYSQFKDLVIARELADKNEETIRVFMEDDYTPEDLMKKIDTLTIKQDQGQFRSPLSYHIAEEIGTIVQKVEVNKSFKIQYSKGNVDEDGWITPLHLETKKIDNKSVVCVVPKEEEE